MNCRQVSIFKNQQAAGKEAVLKEPIHKTDTPKQARADGPVKKREQTTKQLLIPAVPFLKCAARRNRADRPVSLSLRSKNDSVSWNIKNREELLALAHWEDVERANLIYFRDIHGILYIDICKNGRFTVDKNCLPGVRHLGVLSENEIIELWNLKESA